MDSYKLKPGMLAAFGGGYTCGPYFIGIYLSSYEEERPGFTAVRFRGIIRTAPKAGKKGLDAVSEEVVEDFKEARPLEDVFPFFRQLNIRPECFKAGEKTAPCERIAAVSDDRKEWRLAVVLAQKIMTPPKGFLPYRITKTVAMTEYTTSIEAASHEKTGAYRYCMPPSSIFPSLKYLTTPEQCYDS